MRILRRLMFAAAIVCATCATVRDANAAEGGVLDYAPGAPGPFVGMFPPVPGVFLMNQNFIVPSSNLYGSDGKRSSLPIKAATQGTVQRILISYPGEVFGAKLAQQLILPFVNLHVTAFGHRDSEFGLGNVIVSPVILTWPIAPKQFFTFGLDIVTPWGSFDRNRDLNIALNYTSVQPVFAYRYLDLDGFTMGIGTRFLFNTKNSITNYVSGTAVATDFDAGYSIGKLRLGFVGGYGEQLENDRQYGQSVSGGNRYRYLGIGPSIIYDFGPVIMNVNYQFGVIARNTVKTDTLWVNFLVPLYVPGGPPAAPQTAPRSLVVHK